MKAEYTGSQATIHWIDHNGNVVVSSMDLDSNNIGWHETERNPMEIRMQWLIKENYRSNLEGLLFLIEERRDLFCDDPRSRIECRFHYGQHELEEIKWDNYQLVLLVSGFTMPDRRIYFERQLMGDTFKRGKIEDGNGRTVYLYVPEEWGLGFSAGITLHDTCGSWSCWENHQFEIDAKLAPIRLFPDFTEKFAYITEYSGSWCLHGNVPVEGKNEFMAVRDQQVVTVPLGGHFTIAQPGQRLAYIWALMGGGRKEYKHA